jgi:hypothetical protein
MITSYEYCYLITIKKSDIGQIQQNQLRYKARKINLTLLARSLKI